MQTGATTVENSMEVPQKIKNRTAFDPVISLLGIHPKNPETPIQENLCTHMSIAMLFTIATCWKQPKCPSVKAWIRNLWHIYTVEYYAAVKNKEVLPFATACIDLKTIMLSEISHSVKDKYMIPFRCGIEWTK